MKIIYFDISHTDNDVKHETKDMEHEKNVVSDMETCNTIICRSTGQQNELQSLQKSVKLSIFCTRSTRRTFH